MELDINCTIGDASYIKVLFIGSDKIGISFFRCVAKTIKDEILSLSDKSIKELDEENKWDNISNYCSEYEKNTPSLRFFFDDVYFYDTNIIPLKNECFINAHVIILIDLMNLKDDSDFSRIKNGLVTELSTIYRVSFESGCCNTDKINIWSLETGYCSFCSFKDLAKKIILDALSRFNSVIKKSIDFVSINSLNKYEVSVKQYMININKKKLLAEIYLLLGLPVSSAMYYNYAIELIEEYNPKLFYELASCIQGQASLLFLFYKLFDSPEGWWEVGSNSINSFIQELPVPLQFVFQQVQSNNFSVLDSIVINQSKKFLLFDIINKKLSIALNLLGKASRINGSFIFDSNFHTLETEELIVFTYKIILLKSRFLLESVITSHFERKLIVDFLDPYLNSIEQTSKVIPKNFIKNYSLFLLGCVNILRQIKCDRKVGIILIRLSQLFLKHKLYGISFNVSCAAYDWYSNIYSGDKNNNTSVIKNLIYVIKTYKDSCFKHDLCNLCYTEMNSDIVIRDTYFYIPKLFNIVNDNTMDYIVSNKQYLNNNYMQYITIYKHDLALKYSALPLKVGFISSENDFQLNIQLDLLLYLKPFINSFVRYGIHSMLQTYRKYNVKTTKKVISSPYPARYEMLVLLNILESAAYYGCPSRSLSALSTLLEKIIYLPPLYDLEVFTTIQSKCIDTLSILSSNLQSPFVKAPLYTLTMSKQGGSTSIESMDLSVSNTTIHSMHLLLLFNISCDTSSITGEPCERCIHKINCTSVLNEVKNNYCSNCDFFMGSASNLPSVVFQASNTNIYFETQYCENRYSWVPIQEKNSNNKTPMALRRNMKSQDSNPFLYDPFQKKLLTKENSDRKDVQDSHSTNVLWEVGKKYTVYVGLFNPFSIPLILDCFSLIIDGNVSCDIYPVSVVVPPTPRFSIPGYEVKVAVNITPKNPGYFKVVGITYKFSGIIYINFGAKTLFANNGPLMPYINVFAIKKLNNDIHIDYNEISALDSLSDETVGNIEIRNIMKVPNELRDLLNFENYCVMIEKSDNTFDIICNSDINSEECKFYIKINYFDIAKLKHLKLLLKTMFLYEHKIAVFSTVFILKSRNIGFPIVRSSLLIPKIQYGPVTCDFMTNRWEISRVWLVLEIEKNCRLFPIELYFPKQLFDNKITIPNYINSYRWVIEASFDQINKLNKGSEFFFLNWCAHLPNSSIDSNDSNIIQQGKIPIGKISYELNSNYVFNIYIECNGVQVPNNSVLPVFSPVYVKVGAENKETKSKSGAVKLIPVGETSRIKQIYLDYSNGYATNSELLWFSFSIIGLEKKTFEWIVGVEETDLISNETIFHWKSEVLSISFN